MLTCQSVCHLRYAPAPCLQAILALFNAMLLNFDVSVYSTSNGLTATQVRLDRLQLALSCQVKTEVHS